MRWALIGSAMVGITVAGCGGDGTAADGTDTDTGTGTTAPQTTMMSASNTMGPTMTTLLTMSDSNTSMDPTSGTTEDGTGSSGSDESSSTTGLPKGCDGMPGQPRHIWISNSMESTISKINTETLAEEARYITREDNDGNPSRTSVNYNGDVAVANRNGGITVFAGDVENCPDPLTTSSGADDVVAYPDGCMLWHTPFAYASQRPIAWTQGEWSNETCRFEETKLWTSGANAEIEVILLDGDTGDVEQTIAVEGVAPNFFGIYGGAVDSAGNFWGSQLSAGSLVRVQLSDFAVDSWPMQIPGYGMTVDPAGMVWTCSDGAARFDPGTEMWDTFPGVGGNGGCNVDGDGVLWMANNPLVGVNTATGAVVQEIDVPNYVHGVAIDFDGFVWGVALGIDEAYRIDPVTETVDTVTGLVSPYTYSDMTGFSLQNVGP